MEQGHSALPQRNMEGPFYKSFSWKMEDNFLGGGGGGGGEGGRGRAVLHGGLMIRLCEE